jgi:hypothetical protein
MMKKSTMYFHYDLPKKIPTYNVDIFLIATFISQKKAPNSWTWKKETTRRCT